MVFDVGVRSCRYQPDGNIQMRSWVLLGPSEVVLLRPKTMGLAWLWEMAHRNRWFTVLKHGDFPWRTVSHNQMISWGKLSSNQEWRANPAIRRWIFMNFHGFSSILYGLCFHICPMIFPLKASFFIARRKNQSLDSAWLMRPRVTVLVMWMAY